ncbi:glycoside hydrolase family 44 protein [Magnetospirillum molischianum]|uniref:Cellulase n=1 Tax=Magnetospirillum molischianum DSM 120 TaxID=1150626 RepID=H8FWD6_MAGML|nr:glycoside hydrolase family 44 protein [Magnetospirillum molischianum]CCG42674.1 Cellulase [Magnetospirillum molischianum DSM 120]
MIRRATRLMLCAALPLALAAAAPAPVEVTIDAGAERRPISPLIYGVGFAPTATLRDLNLPLNRSGGNSASLYNWRINARNAGKDWFFESLACSEDIFDQHGEGFIALSKAAGAEAMLTIPMIGWVARLDAGRKPLASFSIGKYGLQQEADLDGFTSAGNGITIDGTPISDNDPNDAAEPSSPEDQAEWVRQLVAKWGGAAHGGLRYYIMDNEPSFWHGIHRDVHPEGAHAREVADKVKTYAAMVKAIDPQALVVAPEEWGWGGYRYSGFDQQYADTHGFDHAPDRTNQTEGMDYLPWLLTQWKAAGHPVDVVSVHYYPQGGEYREKGDDVSREMQLRRNRSTRDLWDQSYHNPTWINDTVALIPRLRRWVDTYYHPGTPIALTEYNWGAETTMNGATAQADLLGIFGREGLDLAARWAAPAPGSPTYLAFKLYRNYDGKNSTFGDQSVAARAPDPDTLATFAALRASDGALTVVAINKQIDAPAPLRLTLARFAAAGAVESYRLVDGKLAPLPPTDYSGGGLATELPPQSVTLFVLRGASTSPPALRR